jgi:nucleotidyltransferase/DNA polymerase involved in DNA repair
MKNRYIIHVDMDAFFAAIEERDRPELKGKPIVIGADPKKGKGRGVVSTCSYEARKCGIHSAMPISIAYKKCPECVFLPVDLEKYNRVSAQIVEILSGFSPTLEQVSVDEAFLDITGTYKLFGTPHETCLKIKERIKKETGLTASIGLAPNKMAAKIASGLKKPDGLVEVEKEGLISFLEPLDIGLIWGVGPKTKAELNRMGISTIGDLAGRSEDELISLFGKNGAWFWEVSRGIDESEVVTEREAKSISNESTFDEDTADRRLIEKELSALSELVADRLREEKIKARTITLKIRLEGFRTYTRAATLQEPTNFTEDVIRAVQKLYEDFEIKERKVRLVGVRASNLSSADEPDLFRARPSVKTESLHKAVDKIKARFGKSSISRASGK